MGSLSFSWWRAGSRTTAHYKRLQHQVGHVLVEDPSFEFSARWPLTCRSRTIRATLEDRPWRAAFELLDFPRSRRTALDVLVGDAEFLTDLDVFEVELVLRALHPADF